MHRSPTARTRTRTPSTCTRPQATARAASLAAALLLSVVAPPGRAADPFDAPPVPAVPVSDPAAPAADPASPRFSATFYLWASGLRGKTSTLPPLPAANVDLSFGDILENFDGGIMGKAEMRLGRWSLIGDAMFTQVSPSGTLPAPFSSGVEVRSRSLTLQGNALYRLYESDAVSVDAGAGARFWYLDNRLDLAPGARPTRTIVTEDESWVDPVVAGRVIAGLGGPWGMTVAGDIGGFSVGSDLTWQAIGTIDYEWSDKLQLRAGYRALSVDYQDGKFLYDVLMQGPVVGLTYRF